MDDRTYEHFVAELERGRLEHSDLEPLAAEAERRADARIQVLAALANGDEERAAKLTESASVHAVRAIVMMLGGWRNDLAWHLLFHIAQTRPALLSPVEEAVASWSDYSRVMPNAWWREIRSGLHQPWHRLVRNFELEGEDVSALREEGARLSLNRLTCLGLRKINEESLLLAMRAELDAVQNLTLSSSAVSPELIADLLVGPAFPQLASLELASLRNHRPSVLARSFPKCPTPDPLPLEQIAKALGGRTSGRLRFDLELKALGVDAIGLRALVAQPALRGVATLSFTFSVIGPEEIAILASGEHARELTGIALHIGKIGETGARSLFDAPFISQLKVLQLPNQATTDELGGLLSRGPAGTLEVLELPHNQLGSRTAEALANADLGRLRRLVLSFNSFTDTDLGRVLGNPTLRALETLELIGTGANVKSARALAESEQLKSLRTLNVGDAFGDEATEFLAGSSLLRSLTRLQVIGASDAAVQSLSLALPGAFVTNAHFA